MQGYMILRDYGGGSLGLALHAGPYPTKEAAEYNARAWYATWQGEPQVYHICPIQLPEHTYFHPSRYET